MDNHLKEEEIQGLLDGGEPDSDRLRHLDSCTTCRNRYDRFGALFALLGRMERLEPSPRLEALICARLFPPRAPAFRLSERRIPDWARPLAPLSLLVGSAALCGLIRMLDLYGGAALEWTLRSHPGILALPIRLLSAVLPTLFRVLNGLGDFFSVASVTGRALLLTARNMELWTLTLTSVGLLVLLAVVWRTRLVHSLGKEGHNDLLCI